MPKPLTKDQIMKKIEEENADLSASNSPTCWER